MKNILTKGHGIIITGDKGTGRPLLAKAIAKSIGFFAVADFKGITGPYNSVFLVGAEVVVVTDFNPTEENLAVAIALVANEKIAVERQGYDTQIVDTPCFIFVTNNNNTERLEYSVTLSDHMRRFTIIDIH